MEVNNKNVLSGQDNIQLVAAQKVMSAEEFVEKCLDIAANYNTVYMNGVFGWPVTQYTIDRKRRENPSWYTEDRVKYFTTLIGEDYLGSTVSAISKRSFGAGTATLTIFTAARNMNRTACPISTKGRC